MRESEEFNIDIDTISSSRSTLLSPPPLPCQTTTMDGGDIEWELDRASSIKHATLESNDGDDSQERPLSSSSRRSSQVRDLFLLNK